MIKIINAAYIENYTLKLEFSEGSFSHFDFSYLLSKDSELTASLKDIDYFKSFFIELGALCWKNGLELSPESLYQKAKEKGKLHKQEMAA